MITLANISPFRSKLNHTHFPYEKHICSLRHFLLQPTEIEVESQVHLYGHTAEVTGLFVCKPYSILISVSRDGTCILWDLNRYFLFCDEYIYVASTWSLTRWVFLC